MTETVICIAIVAWCLTMLHAMQCPGRRWGSAQAGELAALTSGMVDGSNPSTDEQSKLLKEIGDLIWSSDDLGMSKRWIPIILLTSLEGDRELLVLQLRQLNERSAWLARKSDRCHLKWLPTRGLPVTRGVPK